MLFLVSSVRRNLPLRMQRFFCHQSVLILCCKKWEQVLFLFYIAYSYFETLLIGSVCHIVYRSAAESQFLDMFFSPSVFSFSSNFVQIKNCQNIRQAETFDRQSGRRPLCHPDHLLVPRVPHAVCGRCHSCYALPILQTGTHLGSFGNTLCVCVCVCASVCVHWYSVIVCVSVRVCVCVFSPVLVYWSFGIRPSISFSVLIFLTARFHIFPLLILIF